jgi:F0F1-type ATP synthase membrane subunit b/b'
MTPLKRFFLLYFGLYLGGMLLINLLFGPPGMSRQFTSDPVTREAYEHYLEIIKSERYKRWQQNPQIDPAATPGLPEQIEFVQAFETRPFFQAEMRRRERYRISGEMFHVAMMLLLIIKFARRPLLRFLDQGIDRVRQQIAQAEAARREAMQRRSSAAEAIARLDEEKARIEQEGRLLMDQDLAQIHTLTEQSVAHVLEAAEDQKREEMQAAMLRLRAELVDRAVQRIVDRFESEASEREHQLLLTQFVDEVERLR